MNEWWHGQFQQRRLGLVHTTRIIVRLTSSHRSDGCQVTAADAATRPRTSQIADETARIAGAADDGAPTAKKLAFDEAQCSAEHRGDLKERIRRMSSWGTLLAAWATPIASWCCLANGLAMVLIVTQEMLDGR